MDLGNPRLIAIIAAIALISLNTRGDEILLAGCTADASEAEHQVDSEIVLATDWIPQGERDAFIREAIERQLLYVDGFLQNDAKLKRDGVRAMGAWRAPFEILAEQEIPYSQVYDIDPFRTEGLVARHPYLARAVKAGKTKANQSGLRIKYRTRIRIARCPKSGTRAEVPKWLLLPKDPFLALWTASSTSRRNVRFENVKGWASPCATDEMAMLGNALEFWHLWNPNGDGCNQWLERTKSLVSAAAVAVREKTPELARKRDWLRFLDAEDKLGKPSELAIRMGAVFRGHLRRGFRKLPYSVFKSQIQWLTDDRLKSRFAVWNQTGFEPESSQFLIFIRSLASAMVVRSASVIEAKSDHLSLELTGTLLKSKRWVKLTLSHASADSDLPHLRALYDSLARDHVVFLSSQTVLGGNYPMTAAALAKGVSEDTAASQLRAKPAQLIAYLNGYSYSHFGADLAKIRDKLATEMLLAASPDSGARYALVILETLDRNAMGDAVDIKAALEAQMPEWGFLVDRMF